MSLIHVWAHRAYLRVLIDKANSDHQTAEKLPDGNFYYIVPETDFNNMRLIQLREQYEAVKGELV